MTANEFLCTAPDCDFLSQNLDRHQDKIHYNLLHSDLTCAEHSFIAIHAEMAEAMDIFNEVYRNKDHISKVSTISQSVSQ